MNDAELLAKLPLAARDALRLAREAKARAESGDATAWQALANHTDTAFDTVGIPKLAPAFPVFPRAEVYDDVQRALLAYTAIHELGASFYACPWYAQTRRRWLGIDPPGLLETLEVEIENDGTTTKEPLFRALQLRAKTNAVIATLNALPMKTLLAVVEELWTTGGGYRIAGVDRLSPSELRVFQDLGDEGREWAIACAECVAAKGERKASGLDGFVFLALVRARVPLERRWAVLFPRDMFASKELRFECARALPPKWRGAVLAGCAASFPWATELLAEFPEAEIAEAWLGAMEPNSPHWLQRVETLRQMGEAHPAIAAMVERVVAANPKPLVLPVARLAVIASASELTALEREQLRIAGRGYDGRDLDADARLADDGSEESFKGFFEIRNIADRAGETRFDALLFMTDAGVIFRAGTTNEIGAVSQGGVVLQEKDDALRLGLQIAIGASPVIAKGRAKKPSRATSSQKAPRAKASASKKPRKPTRQK